MTARGDDTHECPIAGCSQRVPYRRLMCGRHWALVSYGLRARLQRAWDRGHGAGSDAHQELMPALHRGGRVEARHARGIIKRWPLGSEKRRVRRERPVRRSRRRGSGRRRSVPVARPCTSKTYCRRKAEAAWKKASRQAREWGF